MRLSLFNILIKLHNKCHTRLFSNAWSFNA